MQRKKVVHIHSDLKFIQDNTKKFEGEYFDNRIILLDGTSKKGSALPENTKVFRPDEVTKIVKCCQGVDLVVLHALDIYKSKIALALPPYTTIAWRFFGYELYNKRKELVLSATSLSYFKKERLLRQTIVPAYHWLRYGGRITRYFYKAVTRINYMMVLSKNEYDFLETHWQNLPEFVKLPHRAMDVNELCAIEAKSTNEKQWVVIGNSRSAFNNHLDVLRLIDQNKKAGDYRFKLLFNYGAEKPYVKAVRQAVRGKAYYDVIDDFMPKQQFLEFYAKISALVINSYRQMAGTNILLALQYGVKVYLNEKNSFYHWMKKEGFQVFTIQEFESDLKEGAVGLLPSVAKENFDCFKAFSKRYTAENFQAELYKKL